MAVKNKKKKTVKKTGRTKSLNKKRKKSAENRMNKKNTRQKKPAKSVRSNAKPAKQSSKNKTLHTAKTTKINVPKMPKLFKPKPKKGLVNVAVHSFTACSGCQLEIVHSEDILLELMEKVNIISFHLVKEKNSPDSKADIAIVEGSITTKEQEDELKNIRKRSGIVIAIGACACDGGVQSIRNILDDDKVVRYVYGKKSPVSSIKSYGIDKYIKVDYYVRGCPINKHELIDLIKKLLVGQIPKIYNNPVCVECRLKENPCLLQQGKFCMGPLTVGGCEAICTSFGNPCEGCRGPLEDAATQAAIRTFKEKGMTKDEMKRLFTRFAPNRYAGKLDKEAITNKNCK